MSSDVLKNNFEESKPKKGGLRAGSGRKPGVSKATLLKRKIQEYFSEEEVLELLVRAKKEAKVKPEMLKFLLEQLFGKAPQRIEMTGEDGGAIVVTIAKEVAEKYGITPNHGSTSSAEANS